MEHRVLQYCIFLRSFLEVISSCHQSSHPNFCGYNGNEHNISEFEGVCDCQTMIFCSVISFVRDCQSSVIQLGMNESSDTLIQLNCDMLSLESQAQIPTLEVLNNTGNDLSVRVPPDLLFGKYKVFCTAPEVSEEFNNTSNNEWEITGVDPAKVFVDSEVNLRLTINKADGGNVHVGLAWCFMYSPDGNTEALSAVDISEEQLTCAAFRPVIPGVFRISLSYNDTFEQSIEVTVLGKHPIAQKAEYDSDFKTIFVSFDANIELHSKCTNAFPKTCRDNFGAGFDCYARANILGIKMGGRFEIINSITINSDNKICREGYRHSGFCLSALPANLNISKPKVSGPSLSFYTNDVCAGNKIEKYISVRVFNLNQQIPPFKNQTLLANGAGKTHRKNLMIWRNIRKIQSKLSHRLTLKINNPDFLPLYENLSEFDVDFDGEDDSLSSEAIVSVYAQYSRRSSVLLAEARVRFCDDSVKLFRYNWLLNGRNLSEEGRLLTLSNLPPGKHLVKCVVVAHDSTEILGQGWATAEAFESVKDLLIVPLEAAIGTADIVYLRTVTSSTSPVSWTCRTAVGESCVTRNQNILSDIYDFTSPGIFLPARTLPIANYIWTVESSGEVKVVKIFIEPGELSINVEVPAILMNPSSGVILNGSVQGATERCRAGWSSQREKGFSYLDLHGVSVRQILVDERHFRTEVPLELSPSLGLQADSQYLFKFQVFCPQSGALRYTKVPLRTGTPPAALPITIEPLTGKAMITNFKVSVPKADASVQNFPLVFEWSYIDPCDTEVPLGSGLFARNITTYLPPGDLKIMVRICDDRKMCSTTVSSTVAVIQPAEIQPENFDECLHKIQYLMASGDSREALGLAITVFKSLALLAEFELRQKVLSVVERAIDMRMKDLSEKLLFHPSALQLSREFYDQAETVAKYFHKNFAILKRLKDFRNGLKNYAKTNKTGNDEQP